MKGMMTGIELLQDDHTQARLTFTAYVNASDADELKERFGDDDAFKIDEMETS